LQGTKPLRREREREGYMCGYVFLCVCGKGNMKGMNECFFRSFCDTQACGPRESETGREGERESDLTLSPSLYSFSLPLYLMERERERERDYKRYRKKQ
jgi:hypothetical protein